MKKYTTVEVIQHLESLRQDVSGVFQSKSEVIHNMGYNKKLDFLIKQLQHAEDEETKPVNS
tara:strand:- start:2019 stop:2201 length:183 start_codon:yes stop_codon:yes gene_type:complete